MRNDSENSGLDGLVILGVLAGADVLIDRRTFTVHTFNKKASAAVRDLEDLGMGMSNDDEQAAAFMRALVAQGLFLSGITPDGRLFRLVDKVADVAADDEGG